MVGSDFPNPRSAEPYLYTSRHFGDLYQYPRLGGGRLQVFGAFGHSSLTRHLGAGHHRAFARIDRDLGRNSSDFRRGISPLASVRFSSEDGVVIEGYSSGTSPLRWVPVVVDWRGCVIGGGISSWAYSSGDRVRCLDV